MKKHLVFFGLLLLAMACTPDKPEPVEPPKPFGITRFAFAEFAQVVEAQIDEPNLRIVAQVPPTANIRRLTPTIEHTEGSTLSPASGYAYDFSQGMQFKLSLGDSSKTYSVQVTVQKSNDTRLVEIGFANSEVKAVGVGTAYTALFPFGTPLQAMQLVLRVADKATVSPASGAVVDLTKPLNLVVTAEDGTQQTYTLSATLAPQETAVRAFWIPATWHSTFLSTYDNIKKGVALADELNFNTLYVCAWSQTKSLYPSQVLADNSSYNTPREGMFNNYNTGSGDPLADLVKEAHALGLKVILWYEYGFMAQWGSAPNANDPLLAAHPEWAALGSDGKPSNYNNTDFYYNAYHEGLQQFMIDLMLEAVTKYDIDGVQGDDRLPAMPRNSGYDDYTKARYKQEKGIDPPQNFNETNWVAWRGKILNDFAKKLYADVKKARSSCLVGMSPNPYPWAYEVLMQDWPQWLADGAVDVLSVQCYRINASDYATTVDQALQHFKSKGDARLERFAPGILLKGSHGLTTPEQLKALVKENRKRGILGEAYFYDMALWNDDLRAAFKSLYPGKAKFPSF